MHTQLENTVPPADPCHYHENSRAITALTRDLSNLRCDLTQLRSELANLRCSPPNGTEACSLYVKVKQHTKDEVTNSMLCDILKCPIVSFSIICHAPAVILRVKILNSHLYTALTKPDCSLITVRIWKVKPTRTDFSGNIGLCKPPHNRPAEDSPHSNLKIVTWNCRGLNSGEPYIHHLAEEGYNIIAITEHWLWPYEAERLCTIHPSFVAEVKTDSRLNENSTLQRGCGGVGLLWRKSLNATPISSISSDRICGISLTLSLPEPTEMSILGVYLPCMDMGIQCYCDHLVELECLISQRQQLGPVFIMGDFNAHLGTLGGAKGLGGANQQGILLHQLLARCNLYAVSLSPLSVGPQYTFWSSDTQTTVDYIIASHDAADYIEQCSTLEPVPLNNSDHLPISAVLQAHSTNTTTTQKLVCQKINWAKALKSSQLDVYQKLVTAIVSPLLERSYNC